MKGIKFSLLLISSLSLFGCNHSGATSSTNYSSLQNIDFSSKIIEIEDMSKTYFSDQSNIIEIDLSDYISFGKGYGEIEYSINSSNSSVVSVSIEDNIFKANILKGKGSSDIKIDVKAMGNIQFSFNFNIMAREFTKIACVGDSLTAGHAWANQSYPVYLSEQLGIETVNCGVNGANIISYGGSGVNFKYDGGSDTAVAFNKSKTSNADVVIIMLGTNDATGWENAQHTFEEDYRSLIDVYKNLLGVEEIVLVVSPPTLDGNAFNIPNENIKNHVNPIQRKVANDLNLPIVDAREEFEKVLNEDIVKFNSYYRPNDGVHFSVEGAKFIASLIEDKIRTL